MKEYLKKLKLIDHLQTELEIQKSDFVNRLGNSVDEGSTGVFSDAFDVFSTSINEYKGSVNYNGFKIKKRRKLFDVNMHLAVASGTYIQKDNKLIINTEINSFNGMMIPFYIFCIFIYSTFIIIYYTADNIDGNAPELAIPFILFHAALMMGIPYFVMRRSTKKLKHELEREFYYLTK